MGKLDEKIRPSEKRSLYWQKIRQELSPKSTGLTSQHGKLSLRNEERSKALRYNLRKLSRNKRQAECATESVHCGPRKNDIEWSIPRHRQVSHRFSERRKNPWGMEEEICPENHSVGKNHVVVLRLGAGGSLAKSPSGGSVDLRVSHLLQQWFK